MDTEDLPDGFVFRLPGNSSCIALIAELIVAERECCPFLTFEITALPNRGPVMVRVTGPGGAKQFLETVLCDREPPV